MPEGGRLRVELVKDAEVKDGRSFGAVRISDTGGGIAPEHLAHIFDPFYTTRAVGEGTGIGLSVALRIVEEHGGWIDANNNGEGGATFSIYLPQNGSTSAHPSEN
jgi:signal transduction histidine kinase